MANRLHHPLETSAGNSLVLVPTRFVGNDDASPTDFDTKEIASVTRIGAGEFDVVLKYGYPTEVQPQAFVSGDSALHARVTAWDSRDKTLTVVTSAAGGAAGGEASWTDQVAVTDDEVTLGSAGFVVAVHATSETGVAPSWTSGVSVTTNAVTLDFPGTVVAVEATTASDAGVKAIQFSATPDAGFVRVQYTAGVATLTFNGTDAVTECAVCVVRPGAMASGKAIISEGTPEPGQVLVEYTEGVASLTFAEDDEVTEASVQIIGALEISSLESTATDPTSDDTVHLMLVVRNSIYQAGG